MKIKYIFFPHKCPNGVDWYPPLFWSFLFGGYFDTGSLSGWRPNLYYTIKNFIKYKQHKKSERDKYLR